ncbi:hypothetical protein [Sphingomonas sp.]|uniref:hypothetical protein n=1 Tax=Sphingomonas sp. TaxID=28214 RepID=UPI0031D05761
MGNDELITRAIEHAEAYDTPKADDGRRRYTPAQMEIAVRHALTALQSRPAPTEERANALFEEMAGVTNVVTRSSCIRLMLRFATDTTPSRDEEGSVLANWRDEIGHPNNRLLFKRMVEKAGIALGADDIASALAKVAALKTSTPETQTVEVEYEVWQKDAFGDGDAMVAGSTSLAEANHYAAVYSQDGPAWVVEVRRRALSASPTEVVEE